MKSAQPLMPKCLFVAWVFGWVTAIYLPSVSIALLSLSPLAPRGNLFVDAFQVADEVSPAAKLSFAILFGGGLVVMRMAGAGRRLLLDGMLGVLSMMLVVAFLPEDWSRGFGIGLNGIRFEMAPTIIYLIGGFLSGIVFSLFEARCIARSHKGAVDQSAKG
jgi:hypothetical protein